MANPLEQTDGYLLDRVFQPFADWLHDRAGILPAQIAEFFAAGQFLCSVASNVLNNLVIVDPMQLFATVCAVLVAGMFAVFIIFPRGYTSRLGGNPKRFALLYMRLVFLLFFIINTGTLYPLLLAHDMWFPRRIALILAYVASTCVMIGLYFASLHAPPPRRVKQPKTVPVLGEYA